MGAAAPLLLERSSHSLCPAIPVALPPSLFLSQPCFAQLRCRPVASTARPACMPPAQLAMRRAPLTYPFSRPRFAAVVKHPPMCPCRRCCTPHPSSCSTTSVGNACSVTGVCEVKSLLRVQGSKEMEGQAGKRSSRGCPHAVWRGRKVGARRQGLAATSGAAAARLHHLLAGPQARQRDGQALRGGAGGGWGGGACWWLSEAQQRRGGGAAAGGGCSVMPTRPCWARARAPPPPPSRLPAHPQRWAPCSGRCWR